MRELLDSSTLRRLKLLELLSSDDDWWTIEELSRVLDYSERTIKADIHYYQSLPEKDRQIVTSKQRGVRFLASYSFQMESVYQETMKSSLNSQIIERLYDRDFNSIEDFARRLFTSASSLSRYLKDINSFLNNYDLTIQSKPVKMVGSEKQFRFFYCIFFWEKYNAEESPFPSPLHIMSKKIVDELGTALDLSLSSVSKKKLSLWLFICLSRIQNGHYVENYEPPMPVSKEIIEQIKRFGCELPFALPENDLLFLGSYFQNRYVLIDQRNEQNEPQLMKIGNEIDHFLEEIKMKTGFLLTNKEMLKSHLLSNFLYKCEFKGNNFLLVDRIERSLDNMAETYDYFSQIVIETLNQLELTEWVLKMQEDKKSCLYILISVWENLTEQSIRQQKAINVLIVSQFGSQHERFLANQLVFYFSNRLKLYTLSENRYKMKKTQLILTDIFTNVITDEINKEAYIVSVDYSLSTRNLKMIRHVINEIQKGNSECKK